MVGESVGKKDGDGSVEKDHAIGKQQKTRKQHAMLRTGTPRKLAKRK